MRVSSSSSGGEKNQKTRRHQTSNDSSIALQQKSYPSRHHPSVTTTPLSSQLQKINMNRRETYCGNNAYELENKRLGSRYECFRKGVGVGLNLPIVPERYEPIDRYRVYCGNARRLPQGYNVMGTRADCLRKGVGVGKKMAAER
jgi:hypothetical protein